MNNFETKQVDDKIKIEKLYEYLKTLNAYEPNYDNDPQIDLNDQNDTLDPPITEEEIRFNLKRLHNNKSPSDDRINNEFLKCTIDILLPLYKDYLNTILDTGIVPDSWLKGILCPIHKRSGNPFNPETYRTITLVSRVSKLFTAGFRSGYTTANYVILLHTLLEIPKVRKMKRFCCFVDFRKAFDSVLRMGL